MSNVTGTVYVKPPSGKKSVSTGVRGLIKITDQELNRHAILAYQDGYADALNGDSPFVPDEYGLDALSNYNEGFKAGERVRRIREFSKNTCHLPSH